LQEVAKISAKAGVPITWTTPIGFMPRQEYLEQKSVRVESFFGGIRIRLTLAEDVPDKLDKRKQKDGIAPNFVHSMDASHLMLTVNKCKEAGITNFSMIHDSYGTHACDTEKLSELLREAFIEQYQQPVLDNFREEVQQRVLEEELPEVPKKGDLDLSLVRQSRYFFA
jgi:DNA-directed RNA polymerase